MKAKPIPAHDRASVACRIQAPIREGSLHNTNEWQVCATLKLREERVVTRTEGGKPMERDHVHGIEQFWS